MEATIDFKGKQIHYTISGQGKALVLLHGFLESRLIWDNYSRALSDEFKVICIDLPGFGKSDVFAETHSMEFMAEAVRAVLDENRIDNCVISGHSMGGYVALAFADKYPEKTKGISLFHSHAAADNDEVKENRERTIDIVKKGRKDFIHSFIPTLFAKENAEQFRDEIDALRERHKYTSAEAIVAALRGMKERRDHRELLRNAAFPIQFIIGKKDEKIPFENALSQAGLPDHSDIKLLGNVGHMGFIEAEQICLDSLRNFAEICYK